jgi:hypothetical protein
MIQHARYLPACGFEHSHTLALLDPCHGSRLVYQFMHLGSG